MNRSSMLMTLCLILILTGSLHIWEKWQRHAARPQAEAVETLTGKNKTAVKTHASRVRKIHSSRNENEPAEGTTKQAHQEGVAFNSLNNMAATLFEFARPGARLDSLLEFLKSSHQDPFVVNDSNADTGTMTIVRTNSPLPGTRYFHAQYFEDENGEKFVQHMSFEFKPGPDSLREAMASVEKTFGSLGKPSEQQKDFVQWELQDGYVLWIKRLNAQDLADNPFNAYSASDVGSIRIAIEQSPHEHGG